MGLQVMLICEFVFLSDIFDVKQRCCSIDKTGDVTILGLWTDYVHILSYVTRKKTGGIANIKRYCPNPGIIFTSDALTLVASDNYAGTSTS